MLLPADALEKMVAFCGANACISASDAGPSRDGKRKVAEKIGLLKCQITIYRKEDEAVNGKSKKWGRPTASCR